MASTTMRCWLAELLGHRGPGHGQRGATSADQQHRGGQVTAPTGPVGGHLVEQVEGGEAHA